MGWRHSTDDSERTTLAQVAAAAGVSPATVSKVVNGRADVSAATRARVLAVLDEHRYSSPQRGAGPGSVDLVLPGLDSPWAVEILRGVEQHLRARGQAVTVSTAGPGSTAHPAGWSRAAARRHAAGVLLVMSQVSSEQWQELHDHGIPLVAVDPADTPGPEIASVGATNLAGGTEAVLHLLDLGHHRVAVVSGPERYACSRARVEGWAAAHAQRGLSADPALVRWGDFRFDGGLAAADALLDAADPPTAVFAGNDEQALGVVEAARRRGLQVPGDLSVVGFDDLPTSRWLSPPLTTVRQPLAAMGAAAAQLLDDLVDGRAQPGARVELETELVVRASTAPPR